MAQWPVRLTSADDQRILFAAEMGGVSPELAILAIRDRPFLSVCLAEFDTADLGDDAPSQIAKMLRLLTDTTELAVAIHRGNDGRFVAFRTEENASRWITETEVDDFLEGHAASVIKGGPLAIVSRLWQTWLREMLTSEGTNAPHPRDWEEAASFLESHAIEVAANLRAHMAAIAPPGHEDQLAAAVGPLGLRAVVKERQNGDWSVFYRPAEEVKVTTGSTEAESDVASGYRGKSSIRYLLSIAPEREASARILKALDELTLPRWASQS